MDPSAAPSGDPQVPVVDYDAVLTRAESVLDGVDAAMARLDDGTYGTCEICGGPIDEDRLARDPIGRTCAGHAPEA